MRWPCLKQNNAVVNCVCVCVCVCVFYAVLLKPNNSTTCQTPLPAFNSCVDPGCDLALKSVPSVREMISRGLCFVWELLGWWYVSVRRKVAMPRESSWHLVDICSGGFHLCVYHSLPTYSTGKWS